MFVCLLCLHLFIAYFRPCLYSLFIDSIFRCPLYSNTNELHRVQVTKGAEAAKAEMGIAEDPKKLKIDPTADLHQHYKKHNDKHPVVGVLPHYHAPAVSVVVV